MNSNSNRPRFDGVQKYFGIDGLTRLEKLHVAIVGLGGVGSWAAETLARSGVGRITLMDLDEICLSNTNRQIHACEGGYGKLKTQAMRERIQNIAPECEVDLFEDFFDKSTSEKFFDQKYDFVIDCIDGLQSKCLLISECYYKNIPIVTVGGAGGKCDPTQITIADLNKSYNDKLLMRVRKVLRRNYRISKDKKRPLGIYCVFSPEDTTEQNCDIFDEFANQKMNCSGTLGSLMQITATMGIMAASIPINLAGKSLEI